MLIILRNFQDMLGFYIDLPLKFPVSLEKGWIWVGNKSELLRFLLCAAAGGRQSPRIPAGFSWGSITITILILTRRDGDMGNPQCRAELNEMLLQSQILSFYQTGIMELLIIMERGLL